MNNYGLKIPSEVFAGKESLELIPQLVSGKFSRAVIFTDKQIKDAGLLKKPLHLLQEAGLDCTIIDGLKAEPKIAEAQKVIDEYCDYGADLIVAIGGGSVVDIAKLASLCPDTGLDVNTLIDNPCALKKQVKTLMIPTTAGTGAEATPNAIVTDPEKQLKIGIVNKEMIADYVILDGQMIRRLPPHIAAATGIDALCHALECFTSNKATPFSDLFAREAIKLIFQNLLESVENPEALEEKNNMLLASFYAGISIAASGTTAVHALSYPLGGKYHIPHGVSNAIMLMPVMRFNRETCLSELGEIFDLLKTGEAGSPEYKTDYVLNEIEKLVTALKIPSDLSGWNVGQDDLEDLVAAGMKVQRLLKNNKRTVSADDARALYSEVL